VTEKVVENKVINILDKFYY